MGMMGDDGEKFGTWPDHLGPLLGRAARWVERFFSALEANSGLADDVPRHRTALDQHPPIGRVYLPTGSYAEMGEWSLPVEARRDYTAVLHDAVEQGRPEARWMRGGFWRSFQVKYREINDLHKQMLRASAQGRGAGPGATVGEERVATIGPPLPGPVQRLLLARTVRRHLPRRTCAWPRSSISSRRRMRRTALAGGSTA